ncbi:uncharacterized protein LOC102198644 [Pundamilia nyererei]|uniref:XK-related protein n=1 Tax=Pundamilia nyererei TaxID=303518 RepID=A0A9Y6M667_9CICH|nr:PREDICTED: uncharacterized protein LOC102198644 [Pundamilia nyererei]
MFSYFIFLVASSVTFLCTHQVSSQDSSCTENPVFTPSALVVKYGDPANVTCVVCQKDCSGDASGLEHPVGNVSQNGSTMFWTVDRLTEWELSLLCYHTNDAGDQCASILNPTLYQPPESVSISFVNHTEMMFENQQYTLQCSVQNVAPVQSLNVTFYRGNTALGHLQSNSEHKKPVNETFTLNITPSREDDGAQYWCETKLELRPAGPQPPPVVTSESVNVTAYFLKAVGSASAIAFNVTAYHRSLRSFLPAKENQNITSSVIYFMWILVLFSSRLTAPRSFRLLFHPNPEKDNTEQQPEDEVGFCMLVPAPKIADHRPSSPSAHCNKRMRKLAENVYC